MKTKALAVLLLSVSALSTVAQRTTRPRLRPQPQEPSMEFPAAAPCIVVPDSGAVGRPEDSLLRRELLDTLTEGITSLRENEQLVVSLYYKKNLSMKEIAQVMEVSEPRISQLHSRAIQKLKLFMNQYMTGNK